ncbi:MAG: hypothetical protein OXL37_19000 [Chloroflexota bacterium]|nr:hypothetical protein [Chloroflexota bacterium]MDE2958612.1 hypothetical protein [Chloroflexota bacterium]
MGAINSWRKRHFLGTDALIALFVSTLIVMAAYVTEAGTNVHVHFEQNLLMLYRTTATIAGTLMGFSMAGTVMAINFWQDKWFDLIKRDDKSTREIWVTLKQTTWCLALLTATALFVIAAGGGSTPDKWTIVPYLIAFSIAVARLMRSVSIIHRMLDIAVQALRNN